MSITIEQLIEPIVSECSNRVALTLEARAKEELIKLIDERLKESFTEMIKTAVEEKFDQSVRKEIDDVLSNHNFVDDYEFESLFDRYADRLELVTRPELACEVESQLDELDVINESKLIDFISERVTITLE